ncbi:MAG: gamma-glutamyl-gamma-aminobutyrate hydrolase family protein [Bacteriovoracaceae bacterium]
MKIAITDCGRESKQLIYTQWLRSFHPKAKIETVSYRNGVTNISGYDGVVLTGGEDVDPALSKAAPAALVEETDRQRDDFEFDLLHQARKAAMPVFGICRGLQVANVFYGGTLIADLPTVGFRSHAAKKGDPELRHTIDVKEGTLLHSITSLLRGEINSYHHQSVMVPAEELLVSGSSDDGVVEAMEWKEKEGKPFLLLVQWHPERMTDRTNPFTNAVASAFFAETEQYYTKK